MRQAAAEAVEGLVGMWAEGQHRLGGQGVEEG